MLWSIKFGYRMIGKTFYLMMNIWAIIDNKGVVFSKRLEYNKNIIQISIYIDEMMTSLLKVVKELDKYGNRKY